MGIPRIRSGVGRLVPARLGLRRLHIKLLLYIHIRGFRLVMWQRGMVAVPWCSYLTRSTCRFPETHGGYYDL